MLIHFTYTSAVWKTEVQHFSLWSQKEQRRTYIDIGVPIHQVFLVLSVNFLFVATLQRKVDLRRSRSQWPRDLWRVSRFVRLLGLRDRIPPEAWMSVSCECCVL